MALRGLGVLAAIGAAPGYVSAQDAALVTPGPTVVELFTSQSCSSCPPAEAYLGELAARPDLIALEFHVDYWNDLTYGLVGRWTDVHSNPANTERQRAYAARLTNTVGGGVYTPQMVIDGRAEAVGSQPRAVERAIVEARQSPSLRLALATTNGGKTELRSVSAAPGSEGLRDIKADIWLVRYRERETTRVRGGENHGKTLVNHHIVTGMTRLGAWPLEGGSLVFDTGSSVLDDGCAVLVQAIDADRSLGPILGAARCPKGPTPQ